jgi:hypothetical protein
MNGSMHYCTVLALAFIVNRNPALRFYVTAVLISVYVATAA